MRRLVFLIFLVLMPLQSTFASIAAYCQHEKVVTNRHIGHHAHDHGSATSDGMSATGSDEQSTTSGRADIDCSYCHITSAQPLTDAVPVTFVRSPHFASTDYLFALDARDPDRVDRPNWPRFA